VALASAGGLGRNPVQPGSHTALFVWLEDARPPTSPGYDYFDANHFCLLPGEHRTVRVDWEDVPLNERQVDVSGWNTDVYRLV
jgi:hypothetical protein